MTKRRAAAAVAAFLAVGASAAPAPPAPPAQRPAVVQALSRCRAIAEERERLRCFDQASASLDDAIARRDLVVVDKTQVREARRTLFGLEIPRFHLFGGATEEEEVKTVEGVVASAFETADGWGVRLEDGAKWVQTDGKPVAVPPRPGTKVTIMRAALGSYIMRFGNQPGVRAKRQL